MAEGEEQAKETPASSSSFSITVKVAVGLRLHKIALPADATFGDLKSLLAPLTDVRPNEQRLLFKGKPKEDNVSLLEAGVKNNSKILLIEDEASKERKLEETRKNERIVKACEAVANVREEVDKLAIQVSNLEAALESKTKVPENVFTLFSELFMRQILKLDGIEAEGEAKVQRRNEVQRIQRFTDILDRLKVENSNQNSCSTVAQNSSTG